MFLHDGVAAVIADLAQSLLNHCGADERVLLQPVRDVAFVGVEFTGALAKGWSLGGLLDVLPDRLPAHFEMAFNPADGPALGPVEAVQIVDLFGVEHPLSFIRQVGRPDQKDVVCKATMPAALSPQVFQSPRLVPELSCCLQARPRPDPPTKPLQRRVLGPELRCCLQDAGDVDGHLGSAVPGGSAQPPQDGSTDTASSSQDSARATFGRCRGTRRGTRDRRRSCRGGSRRAGGPDTPAGYRLPGGAGTWTAGMGSGNIGSAADA